ncbi:MAG: CocE/NonD family hydrolase [Solirubrobacterales bacterium]
MKRIALLAALLVVAFPASGLAADRGFEKTSWNVPVTLPDESGGPVELETDVYLPNREPGPRGLPLVAVFHGGGGRKDSGFDGGHAEALAKRGYAAILYSQRGHGNSGGQTAVAGPTEMRDAFDVLAWTLGIGGREEPAHPGFQLDRRRIALWGDSQGGLHTNLLQVYRSDRELNPYKIRFRALLPANTPDYVLEALIENQVTKFTFGAGLLKTYYVDSGRVSPLVSKWIASAAADNPGAGELCEHSDHDSSTSSMRQDLAVRSVGCFAERVRPPVMWSQAFDDPLFTPDMAIDMYERLPNPKDRLYLTMAGHAAPGEQEKVARRETRARIRFLDHHLRGKPLGGKPIVFWTRDPEVEVPADAYRYPLGAWRRQSTRVWPPRGTRTARYQLSADGTAVPSGAEAGSLPLSPVASDGSNDAILNAALSSTPLGTAPAAAAPASAAPGSIARFETEPFAGERELSGQTRASVLWTPASPDSQVVVKLFDRSSDGTLTLLGRGVQGLRGAVSGAQQRVEVALNHFSSCVRSGHSLVAYVIAADFFFYKPYPVSLGGTLTAGPNSVLEVPLRKRRVVRSPRG